MDGESAQRAEGLWFNPWMHHTKDVKRWYMYLYYLLLPCLALALSEQHKDWSAQRQYYVSE